VRQIVRNLLPCATSKAVRTFNEFPDVVSPNGTSPSDPNAST
jgi:hypothetical protein